MTLQTLRAAISEIDAELFALIAKRFEICRQLAVAKLDASMPLVDVQVESERLRHAQEFAKDLGLRGEFSRQLMELLILESRLVQETDQAER